MELFFDSNVLLKYMAGDEMAARVVEENSGYINSTVVSEVTYGYIRTITDMSPFDLKNRFATVNVDLEPVRTLLERFTEIPVPPASTILTVISKYKLLPNDATILASMQMAGIKSLATFDADFKRAKNIRLVPEEYWKSK